MIYTLFDSSCLFWRNIAQRIIPEAVIINKMTDILKMNHPDKVDQPDIEGAWIDKNIIWLYSAMKMACLVNTL